MILLLWWDPPELSTDILVPVSEVQDGGLVDLDGFAISCLGASMVNIGLKHRQIVDFLFPVVKTVLCQSAYKPLSQY